MNDKKTPEKDEQVGDWVGAPIQISHGNDRYFAGLESPFVVPAVCHPQARRAALDVIAAQEHLREIHRQRHARAQEYETLKRTTGTPEELMRHKAESEILEGRHLPDAEQAVQDALTEFAAAFWGTRGELRAHIEQEERPAAVRAAQASAGAFLADLRRLAELEQAYSGDGLVRVDPADDAAYTASYQRAERRRAVAVIESGWDLPPGEGHVHGLGELISAYARALTPPEPEPQAEVQPEGDVDFTEPGSEQAWAVRNRILA